MVRSCPDLGLDLNSRRLTSQRCQREGLAINKRIDVPGVYQTVGYTHAVLAGDMLFTAGVIARDSEGQTVVRAISTPRHTRSTKTSTPF